MLSIDAILSYLSKVLINLPCQLSFHSTECQTTTNLLQRSSLALKQPEININNIIISISLALEYYWGFMRGEGRGGGGGGTEERSKRDGQNEEEEQRKREK